MILIWCPIKTDERTKWATLVWLCMNGNNRKCKYKYQPNLPNCKQYVSINEFTATAMATMTRLQYNKLKGQHWFYSEVFQRQMILNRLCYFGVIVHECEHSHVHLQQSTKTQMSSHCRPLNETFSKAMTRTIKQTRHPYTNQWPKTTIIWCVLCINNRRIDLFVWLITNANYRTYNNQPTTKSITTQVACCLCSQTRKKDEGKKPSLFVWCKRNKICIGYAVSFFINWSNYIVPIYSRNAWLRTNK